MIEVGPFDYNNVDVQVTRLVEMAKEVASRISKNVKARDPSDSIIDAQMLLLYITQATTLREMLNEVDND